MAKKSAKNLVNKWQGQPDDAIRLAALRWFAIQIERIGIEIYATNKSKAAAVEELLRGTVKRMSDLHEDIAEPEDCPIGYVLCKDGMCAPMCDGIIGPDSTSSARKRDRS